VNPCNSLAISFDPRSVEDAGARRYISKTGIEEKKERKKEHLELIISRTKDEQKEC
jgi:hypothetical protein